MSTPWVLWLFVGAVALWGSITLVKGLMGRPGSKLSPQLRRVYP